MGAIEFLVYTSKSNIGGDLIKSFMNMKNRGPTDTNYITDNNVNIYKIPNIALHLTRDEISNYVQYNVIYGYHRLSINDNSFNASQPFEDPIMSNVLKYPEIRTRNKRRLLCNGEIYNYSELVNDVEPKNLQSKSDVEIILPLYIQLVENGEAPLEAISSVVEMLDGEWTFVITENINTYKTKDSNIFIARDIFGTRPLYHVKSTKESVFSLFVSELKGIPKNILDNSKYITSDFPIGNIWSFQLNGFVEYYNWDEYDNLDYCSITDLKHDEIDNVYSCIRSYITKSIESRIFMNEFNPIGILLSGGFDSSLITSIVAELMNTNTNIKLHTFSLVKCETTNSRINRLIEYLETKYNIDIIHHQIYIDEQFTFDLKNKLDDIIYNVETYDPKTIRDSILFDLVYKYIKDHTDVKVVLTGEGLDELCGGFSELYDLDDTQFVKQTIKYIKNMCKFDIPKYDKLAGKYGLEVRFPFLQRDFVEYMLKIHPKYKRPGVYKSDTPPIEKYLIRKAFHLINALPEETIWIPASKDNCYSQIISNKINEILDTISDETYIKYINLNNVKCCKSKPYCKEAYLYRKIFIKYFGNNFKGPGYSCLSEN